MRPSVFKLTKTEQAVLSGSLQRSRQYLRYCRLKAQELELIESNKDHYGLSSLSTARGKTRMRGTR